MKSVRFSWRILPLCALLTFEILSCQKTNNAPPAATQDATKTLLMSATNDVVAAANQEGQDVQDVVVTDSTDSTGSSPVITFIPSKNVYPHQKIIDYGMGIVGPDGVTRKGKKIIEVFVNPMTASGGTQIAKITYANFWVDDINVTGEIDTYLDPSSAPGARVIKVVVNQGLSSSNGDSKTYTATHLWKQIEGGNTTTAKDDVYEITGSATGNETLDGSTAIQWTAQVDDLKHVIKPVDCAFRTKGGVSIKLHIVTGGGSDFTEYLDYGDGSCDNKATLSINGGTPQNITLPLRFWPLSI